jgi:site-specific DNA-methyltransferase (adenine-specific)
MRTVLVNSDCLVYLSSLPDNSIDAGIMDPPYGLSKHKTADVLECLRAWVEGRDYRPKKKGFMGRSWDAWVPGPEIWKEVYRVLKPGGYLAVFAGSRTQDLMGVAVRLSGFSIFGQLQWWYGSGFPHGLQVSNAFDREAGYEDPEIPQSAEAKEWDGYATMLKPSYEPILIAQKPLEGKVLDNIRKWRVGAMNVDVCRVNSPGEKITNHSRSAEAAKSNGIFGDSTEQETHQTRGQALGRWPPDILLSHSERCKQIGTMRVKAPVINRFKDGAKPFGGGAGHAYETVGGGDEDIPVWECVEGCPVHALSQQYEEAPRYFPQFLYQKKANTKERDAGLEGGARKLNQHPTVKPVAIMRWLIQLLCPPNGVVLDAFMGSGTTGIACENTHHFIGIELEKKSYDVAVQRIAYAGRKVEVVPLTTDKTQAIAPVHREEFMYIRKVASSVKRGVEAYLGPYTLIVGPNGAGKTSIVNSIELALTATASDVAGRDDVKLGAELLTLANTDAPNLLYSHVEIQDGESVYTADFSCERNLKTGGSKNITNSVSTPLAVRFPVREVREALSGKPEKARLWILKNVSGALMLDGLMKKVSPEQKMIFERYMAAVPLSAGPTEIDRLLAAKKAIKSRAIEMASEIRGVEALLSNAGEVVLPPDTSVLHAARQDVSILLERMTELNWYNASVEGLQRLYNRVETSAFVLETAQKALEAASMTRAAVQEKDDIDEDQRTLLTSLLLVSAHTLNLETCPICTSPDLSEVGHVASEYEKLWGTLRAHAQNAKNVREAERTVDIAQARFNTDMQMYTEALGNMPPEPSEAIEGLRAALEEAETVYNDLQAAQATWEAAARHRAELDRLRAEHAGLQKLSEILSIEVTDIVRRAKEIFVKRVQGYLPDTDVFDLQLEDGEREVCRFGFRRNGGIETALSGAELARMLLALSATVLEGADPRTISVLIPEERAYDPETLAQTMEALSAAREQVILCSPVAPAYRPEGWTIVDLSQ